MSTEADPSHRSRVIKDEADAEARDNKRRAHLLERPEVVYQKEPSPKTFWQKVKTWIGVD